MVSELRSDKRKSMPSLGSQKSQLCRSQSILLFVFTGLLIIDCACTLLARGKDINSSFLERVFLAVVDPIQLNQIDLINLDTFVNKRCNVY